MGADAGDGVGCWAAAEELDAPAPALTATVDVAEAVVGAADVEGADVSGAVDVPAEGGSGRAPIDWAGADPTDGAGPGFTDWADAAPID